MANIDELKLSAATLLNLLNLDDDAPIIVVPSTCGIDNTWDVAGVRFFDLEKAYAFRDVLISTRLVWNE